MTAYQEQRTRWEIDRNAAVGKAEGLINQFYTDFGWTFVDKSDSQAYWTKLLSAWGMMDLIHVVLFGLIIVVMNRKSS
jgi:putative flippase GtrA